MSDKLLLLVVALLMWGYHEYVNVLRLEVEQGMLDVRRGELVIKFSERFGSAVAPKEERL